MEPGMQDYINRLIRAGMKPEDATVLVMDFARELDFAGLRDYVAEFEALAGISAVYEANIPHVKYVEVSE